MKTFFFSLLIVAGVSGSLTLLNLIGIEEEKVADLQQELRRTERINSSLRDRLIDTEERLIVARDIIELNENTASQFDKSIFEKNKIIDELEKELMARDKMINLLEDELETKNRRLEYLEMVIRRLRETIPSLRFPLDRIPSE